MEATLLSKKAVEEAPLAIYFFHDGRLKFFNRAFAELTGYSSDELSGIEYLTLIHDDFREAVARQTELALAGAMSGLPAEPEIQILRKNGEVRWVRVKPKVFEYRRRPGILGMAEDITERKRAEELLRESEARYRVLAESISDVVFVIDIDAPSEALYVSPSITQLLGYTVDEARSRRMEGIFTPDSARAVLGVLSSIISKSGGTVLASQPPVVLELELVRKDGSLVPVEVNYSVMKSTGEGPARVLAVVRDITDRKALEAERADIERNAQAVSRVATIGEMVRGVAHEINNPLTSVIGYANLLMDRDLPRDVRKDLERISEGAGRIAEIVRLLSLFSRETRPVRRQTDINEVVNSIVQLKGHQLRASGIEVETDLEPHIPLTLADDAQIAEVFLNIISNAETEMISAHGKGRLRITTTRRSGNIRISFGDDGPGISEDNLPRLFMPFFTTRAPGGGMGLGLSVCHGIVGEHGGRIWAESGPGEGATFFVELPVTGEDRSAQQ